MRKLVTIALVTALCNLAFWYFAQQKASLNGLFTSPSIAFCQTAKFLDYPNFTAHEKLKCTHALEDKVPLPTRLRKHKFLRG